MALFGKKENKKEEVKAKKPEASSVPAAILKSKTEAGKSASKHAGAILLSPRITEKGAVIAEQGVYVFNVSQDAGKKEIAQAVRELFNVTPRQVRIAQVPSKKAMSRSSNRTFKTASGKKAYVYLKKGDTIELI